MAYILFYFQIDLLLVWLSLGIFIFWTSIWCVHLIGIVYGKWRLHRKINAGPREVPLPGVSILKPLLGVDSNLFTNLESYFTLEYPAYELLFCLHTDSDPALMVVQSLINRYPKVVARIFTGGEDVGVNPKINNLMPGYKAAKYDLIMIADSGIKSEKFFMVKKRSYSGQFYFVRKDTLLDMVDAMKEGVGIVTQVPFTCDRKGFAATLEKVFFGTGHARIYLAADATGVVCTTGMSSMIRKPALDDLGGICAFGEVLAEDYFFAYKLASKGWKSAISSQPALQNSGVLEVRKFHDRICRWAKLRIAMLPHMIILEPLQECMVLGVLASWAVNLLFQWNSLVFFLIHILAWMLLDYVLLSVIQNGPLPFGKFEFVVSWVYRELLVFPIYLKALINPRLQWRSGTIYKLKWGGKAIELLPSSRPADTFGKK